MAAMKLAHPRVTLAPPVLLKPVCTGLGLFLTVILCNPGDPGFSLPGSPSGPSVGMKESIAF